MNPKESGTAMGLGVIFGVVLYVLTDEAYWIAIGVALGAAGVFGRSKLPSKSNGQDAGEDG